MVPEEHRRRKPRRIPRHLRKDVMRRGVYFLPSLVTTGSMFCGFLSIIRSFNGQFHEAAILILLASFLDVFDGYVARLTKAETEFGLQYDSLSDLVSFGMAPAILAYSWGLHDFGRIGYLATFLYFACTAMRLARFNVQASSLEKTAFQGLPSPAAAGTIATFVLFHNAFVRTNGWDAEVKHLGVVLAVYGLAFLMVSTFKYRSLKAVSIRERFHFHYLVLIVLMLIVIATKPEVYLFPLACAYVLDAPLEYLLLYPKRKADKAKKASSLNLDRDLEPLDHHPLK